MNPIVFKLTLVGYGRHASRLAHWQMKQVDLEILFKFLLYLHNYIIIEWNYQWISVGFLQTVMHCQLQLMTDTAL